MTKKIIILFSILILFSSCSLPSRHFSSIEEAKKFYMASIDYEPKVYYESCVDIKITLKWYVYSGDYLLGADYVVLKKDPFGWHEYIANFDHIEYSGGYK